MMSEVDGESLTRRNRRCHQRRIEALSLEAISVDLSPPATESNVH